MGTFLILPNNLKRIEKMILEKGNGYFRSDQNKTSNQLDKRKPYSKEKRKPDYKTEVRGTTNRNGCTFLKLFNRCYLYQDPFRSRHTTIGNPPNPAQPHEAQCVLREAAAWHAYQIADHTVGFHLIGTNRANPLIAKDEQKERALPKIGSHANGK